MKMYIYIYKTFLLKEIKMRLTAQNILLLQPQTVVQNTYDVLECLPRSDFSNSLNHTESGTWTRGCKNTLFLIFSVREG